MKRTSIVSCVLFAVATLQPRRNPPLPSPPPDDWKGTNFATATYASLVPGEEFTISNHRAITPSGEICSNELNAAIYRQDVGHAFESRAHFDNCAFDEALKYVDDLIAEADGHFRRVDPAVAAGKVPPQPVRDGMLSLGQSLHAVQDFYAHTNYVELLELIRPLAANEGELPILTIWHETGRRRLRELHKGALVSGRVWWSLPHDCLNDSVTHHLLAKDSRDMPAGMALSPWTGVDRTLKIPNYTIAHNLARRATFAYLQWCSRRWPILEKHCGPALKYIVQPDRRSDPPEAP